MASRWSSRQEIPPRSSARSAPRPINEGNALSFTATATDADLPANALTFSLSGTPRAAPSPAAPPARDHAGAFSWTPTEAQGPGNFTSSSASPTTEARPLRRGGDHRRRQRGQPRPRARRDRQPDRQRRKPLSFTATATDPDIPANALTFSLVNGPPSARHQLHRALGPRSRPPASSAGPDRGPGPGHLPFFVWSPTTAARPTIETITVTVNEVNVAPVLAAIGNQTVNEGSRPRLHGHGHRCRPAGQHPDLQPGRRHRW